MAAKVLATKGVMTDSLIGGITELPEGQGKQLSELIRQAWKFEKTNFIRKKIHTDLSDSFWNNYCYSIQFYDWNGWSRSWCDLVICWNGYGWLWNLQAEKRSKKLIILALESRHRHPLHYNLPAPCQDQNHHGVILPCIVQALFL